MAAYTIDDPRDEGPLADLTSAGMWTTAGVIGASSFLQPLLLFTAMFVSYFFPALLAWPLMALFAFVYSTPLLYDDTAISVNFPATPQASPGPSRPAMRRLPPSCSTAPISACCTASA
jgi:hypothetical protein